MPTNRLIKEGTDDQRFGHAPSLRRTRNGWEGSMEFIVDTSNEYEAIVSAGVPGLNAPYSNDQVPIIPNCICVGQEYRYISRKDLPDGTGALGVVTNNYAELGAGGTLPPPTLGQKFTLITTQTETQTIFADQNPIVGPPLPPLDNGNGVAKKVGRITAQVYVYLPLSSFPSFSRLIRLATHKKVNSDAVALPLILGTTVSLTVAIGQAQYEGFTHDVKNGLLEFVHEISLAEDFLHRWSIEREDGSYESGPPIASLVYQSEPFAGLW